MISPKGVGDPMAYASPTKRCSTARSSKSGGRSLYGQGVNDESTFVPLSMLPKFRDIEDTSPSPIVEPTRQHWHMPNHSVKVKRLNTADPYERLHTSQIRTLKQQDINNELVPKHIIENSLPPAGPVIKSTDFFRPSKCDRAKTAPRSPTSANTPMTKALPVFTTTFKPSADDPKSTKAQLRVVSHPLLGVALPKRNPDQNSHGISRNVRSRVRLPFFFFFARARGPTALRRRSSAASTRPRRRGGARGTPLGAGTAIPRPPLRTGYVPLTPTHLLAPLVRTSLFAESGNKSPKKIRSIRGRCRGFPPSKS